MLAEHCSAGEKVEFSFDLTNVEFRQKIVEIYPILENGFFMFMTAGKDNILKELNPGRCCYRCYTPENVYDSERGQGRLYIRKIAENQVILTTSNFLSLNGTIWGRPHLLYLGHKLLLKTTKNVTNLQLL